MRELHIGEDTFSLLSSSLMLWFFGASETAKVFERLARKRVYIVWWRVLVGYEIEDINHMYQTDS